jgi:hypothetical protein
MRNGCCAVIPLQIPETRPKDKLKNHTVSVEGSARYDEVVNFFISIVLNKNLTELVKSSLCVSIIT